MSELSNEDRRAVERLSFFMLKEVCCSTADAMAKMDPEAARTLLTGIETLLTGAIARIDAQQSEGANSTAIALEVGARIADVLDQARASLSAGAARAAARAG
ncbi:hypothetical protein BHAOGJBA_3751 [Methylobacterium hispanicum]|jgi:hypothetical protein|uniref:Uncharacterized protein n=1 Tax=Methylobacterium hispanicum TaxID=270350 RepID=A0AAV4ZNQ1_9HYPH|nr:MULTISPECIES: hypothetical protein [Methylobacterium]GJD90216.1 hypothetical protein BHAOGJBA_3751 [Methylobacterium hispanicum]